MRDESQSGFSTEPARSQPVCWRKEDGALPSDLAVNLRHPRKEVGGSGGAEWRAEPTTIVDRNGISCPGLLAICREPDLADRDHAALWSEPEPHPRPRLATDRQGDENRISGR